MDVTGGFNSLHHYIQLAEHQLVREFAIPLLLCVWPAIITIIVVINEVIT